MAKDKDFDEIDRVSSSFCLAKWLQVTIDLKHGTNHSCHHPERHTIPEELLIDQPSALHNTPFKKKQRKLMLEGVRPPECSYCWNIEDNVGVYQSDRYIKSTDDWALPSIDKVKNLPWDKDINPTYMEVMFDSTCNLSCSYCLADISTSIQKEMEEFGPYPVSDPDHRMPKHGSRAQGEGENSFQKAFWEWLPELSSDLEVLRVTGGEPLLSKQTKKLIDFFEDNPFSNLTLIFNSNLSLPKSTVDLFLIQINKLIAAKKIKSFEVYTSLDSYGEQASYIRSGLNNKLFWGNIDHIFNTYPKVPIVIMCTFNILSIGGISDLIEKVLEYKKRGLNLTLDMSYLKNPFYLRANLADQKLKLDVERSFALLKSHVSNGNFSEHEFSKFEVIYDWIRGEVDQKDLVRGRRDFFAFINEYDKRKKTNFLKTFSSYESFFKTCEKVFLFTKSDVGKLG